MWCECCGGGVSVFLCDGGDVRVVGVDRVKVGLVVVSVVVACGREAVLDGVEAGLERVVEFFVHDVEFGALLAGDGGVVHGVYFTRCSGCFGVWWRI